MVRIVFLHPDLGIGGAERLVVDAGLALQDRGHAVHFVTSHHDPSHSFPETRDGTLGVTTVGDWLPRTILGKCYAACAYFRMIVAALYLVLFSDLRPDVVICDQISACIPFLRLFSSVRIIFYCHFPDQLLTQRKSVMKRLYRKPLDWIEERTTGMADVVLVNSNFTAGVFKDTFKSLPTTPDVLYPSLNMKQFDEMFIHEAEEYEDFTFLSINRYERKKNLGLAIEALAECQTKTQSRVRLIMAGGYDNINIENIQHFEELENLADELGVKRDVTFLKSPSDLEKLGLLRSCSALLYTPSGEHFGIVPIEAMYCQLPVVAVNDGGPLETVADGETGFLVPPTPEAFAQAMVTLVDGGKELKDRLGKKGKERVIKKFSFKAFGDTLNSVVLNS